MPACPTLKIPASISPPRRRRTVSPTIRPSVRSGQQRRSPPTHPACHRWLLRRRRHAGPGEPRRRGPCRPYRRLSAPNLTRRRRKPRFSLEYAPLRLQSSETSSAPSSKYVKPRVVEIVRDFHPAIHPENIVGTPGIPIAGPSPEFGETVLRGHQIRHRMLLDDLEGVLRLCLAY